MLGFVIDMKVSKTPSTLESGGKIALSHTCFHLRSFLKRPTSSKFFYHPTDSSHPVCVQEEGGDMAILQQGKESKGNNFLIHVSEGRYGPLWSEP